MLCLVWAVSLGLVVLALNAIICTAGSGSLPSRCFLLDIDIAFNSSKLQTIDLPAINVSLRQSSFTHFVTNHWPQEETNCTAVNVRYRDLRQRADDDDDHKLVLVATYLYEVGAQEYGTPGTAILECINTTVPKHQKYIRSLNLLSSIPALTGVGGVNIKAYSADYGTNIWPCCVDEMRNCCPKGSTFVLDRRYDNCVCNPGFYYEPPDPAARCHPCSLNTYQPEFGAGACEPCPDGYTTAGEGATSCTGVSECKIQVNWEVQGIFHWKNTITGTRVQHACPYGPENATVERECYLDPKSEPSWGGLDTSVCNPSKRTVSLLELSKRPVNETNAFEVSQSLVMETSMGQELNAYDVALATTSLNAIVNIKNTLTRVSDEIMKVLDNILMAKNETLSESQMDNRTTTRLLNVIERFTENIPLLNGSCSLVGTNIELSVQFPTSQMLRDGFPFDVKTKDFGKILSDKPSSIQTGSRMMVSPEAFNSAKNQSSKRLILIVYRNSKLFPVVRNTEELGEGRSGFVVRHPSQNRVSSMVLAGKFRDAFIEGVENAVELSLVSNMETNGRRVPVCVYWDFEANDGFGNWSTEGCIHVGTKLGHVTCRCNHMTNFAMLLTADPDRDESDEHHRKALGIISYIGCGVSLIAVSLTLLTYSMFRINSRETAKVINKDGKVVGINYLRRSNAQLILCHLCVALIGLLISFLVVATRTPNTTTCRAISIVVHYFLLATLTWMGVEGINMYLAFVKVMSAHVPKFIPKAVVISWGIPVVIVAITGFLAFDDYSSEKSCFLNGLPFYVSVFAPAIAVLVVNFIMFGLTICSLSQMGKFSQEHRIQGYQRVKIALSIMVLLGLTWSFGAMAIGDARRVFQYIFSIVNSFQGLAIFWFHCVRQREVRESWVNYLCKNGSRKRRYTASTTVPANKKTPSSPNLSSHPPHRTDDKCDGEPRSADPNANVTKPV